MRAVTWHGRHDVRVDTVPDPEIVNPRDAIIKITSTAICGSDLHLYDGYIPGMRAGDILGHENHGRSGRGRRQEHAEEGPAGRRPVHHQLRRTASSASKQQFSACDNSNPAETSDASETLIGHPMGGGVRLRPPDRRLCRRPGGISARALFRRRADRHSRRAGRRQGAVPVRHPADRLAGGGAMRHRAGRHGRGVGLRPGRPVRDPVGASCSARTG